MLDNIFKAYVVLEMIDKFSSPIEKVHTKIQTFEDAVPVFQRVGAGMMGLGGLAVMSSRKFLDAAGQMEGYQSTLKNMFKASADSIEQAASMAEVRLSELSAFAANTPFELPEVISAGLQLQSLERYSSDTLANLGDLASVAGKPFEQATSAFAKLATGQKGVAVDMFRDLLISTDDWVTATGKGIKKSGELMATTEEMLVALPKILEAKGFSGMMAEKSKTWEGAISNLSDSVFQFHATYGAHFLAPVKRTVQIISGVIAALVKWGQKHEVMAGIVTRLIGVFALLLIPTGFLLVMYASMARLKASVAANSLAMSKSFKLLTQRLWSQLSGLKAVKAAQLQLTASQKYGVKGIQLYRAAIKAFSGSLKHSFLGALRMAAKGTKTFSITLIKSMLAALKTAIPAVWSFTVALLTCPITWIIIGVVALAGAIYLLIKNFKHVKGTISKLFSPLIKQLRILWNTMKSLWSKIPGWLKPAIVVVGLFVAPFITIPILVAVAVMKIKQHFGTLAGFFTGLWNNIKGGFSTFIGWLLYGVGFITGLIIGVPVFILTKVTEAINGTIDQVKSFPDKVKGFFGGLFGLEAKEPQSLPAFAGGVRNFAGGLALVGEVGPEIVRLPSGSDVYSNTESKRMIRDLSIEGSSRSPRADEEGYSSSQVVHNHYNVTVNVSADDIESVADIVRAIEEEVD